jgi:hypothetical protein
VGAGVESGGVVATGLGTGKANAGDGGAEAVVDTLDEGDAGAVGDARGLDTGLGVGEGEIIFSQRCSGTLAPPISLTSVSQRA